MWNEEFDRVMQKNGYTRLKSDPCVYVRWEGDEVAILGVWVDDTPLIASSDAMMAHLKGVLNLNWEVRDLGTPSKLLGLEMTIRNDSLTISQAKYIEEVLRNEGMENANPVAMPMDPHVKLEPNTDDNEPNRSNAFAKVLGELQYVANCTRPDIAFAVNRLGAYTANPSTQHYSALKRILRYLAGTKDLGITYRKTEEKTETPKENIIIGFADAAYANADNLKSTSGYVFLASGGAITWKSKKQSVIALSSTEAEYVALSEAAREAVWLRNLYSELGFPEMEPTTIRCDNEGSVILSRNPQFHQRSKHIKIRHHWIRDLVQNKTIDTVDCRDPEQTADVLTKALPKPKHTRHRAEMGIEPIPR